MLVIDSYILLKIFPFRIGKYQFHAQLSWRKTFATFSTSFSMEPLRMTCHQVTQLLSNTIKTVLFVSFWNVLEHFVNVYKDSVRKLYREMNFNGQENYTMRYYRDKNKKVSVASFKHICKRNLLMTMQIDFFLLLDEINLQSCHLPIRCFFYSFFTY